MKIRITGILKASVFWSLTKLRKTRFIVFLSLNKLSHTLSHILAAHTNPSKQRKKLRWKDKVAIRESMGGAEKVKKKTTRNRYIAKEFVVVVFIGASEMSRQRMADHIVKSMMALTMSLSLFLSALIALPLLQFACCMTNSMSFSSTPSASTSSSDSSSTGGMILVGSAI